MLVANPEPGFERYHDTSYAITLFTTIVERLSDPPERLPPCSLCGTPRYTTSANARIRATAARVQPALPPRRLDRLRSVRHKAAHEVRAIKTIPWADYLHRFEPEDADLRVEGLQEAHDLAHAAVVDFIRRRAKDE